MKLTRRTVLAASAATLGSSLAAPAVKASPRSPKRRFEKKAPANRATVITAKIIMCIMCPYFILDGVRIPASNAYG